MQANQWIIGWITYLEVSSDSRRDEFSELLDKSLWTNADGSIPMFAALPIVSQNLNIKTYHIFQDNFLAFILLINSIIVSHLSLALTLYFFLRLYHNYQKNRNAMSPNTVRLYKMMNRTLIYQVNYDNLSSNVVFQSAVIFAMGMIPVCVVLTVLISRLHIPFVGSISTGILASLSFVILPCFLLAIVAWIPTLNSLLTICMVPAYRNAILLKKRVDEIIVKTINTPMTPVNKTVTRRYTIPNFENALRV